MSEQHGVMLICKFSLGFKSPIYPFKVGELKMQLKY
jgi:hypothetical protein